jgi:hypothetical protein
MSGALFTRLLKEYFSFRNPNDPSRIMDNRDYGSRLNRIRLIFETYHLPLPLTQPVEHTPPLAQGVVYVNPPTAYFEVTIPTYTDVPPAAIFDLMRVELYRQFDWRAYLGSRSQVTSISGSNLAQLAKYNQYLLDYGIGAVIIVVPDPQRIDYVQLRFVPVR